MFMKCAENISKVNASTGKRDIFKGPCLGTRGTNMVQNASAKGCAAGHGGAMCGACLHSSKLWYVHDQLGICHECSAGSVTGGVFLLVVLILGLVVVFLIEKITVYVKRMWSRFVKRLGKFFLRCIGTGKTGESAMKKRKSSRKMVTDAVNVGTRTVDHFKQLLQKKQIFILVGYWQVVSFFTTVYKIKRTKLSSLWAAQKTSSSLTDIDFVSLLFELRCIVGPRYIQQALLTVGGSIALLLMMKFVSGLRLLKESRHGRTIEHLIIRNSLLFVVLMYPNLVTVAINLLMCNKLPNGQFYLAVDPIVECWTYGPGSRWPSVLVAGAILTPMVLFGFPAHMMRFMWRFRFPQNILFDMGDDGILRPAQALQGSVGRIYNGYKNQYWAWEFFECFRKVVLTSLIQVVMPRSDDWDAMRLVTACILSVALMFLYSRIEPYRYADDNSLQILCHLFLALLFLGHLAVQQKLQVPGVGLEQGKMILDILVFLPICIGVADMLNVWHLLHKLWNLILHLAGRSRTASMRRLVKQRPEWQSALEHFDKMLLASEKTLDRMTQSRHVMNECGDQIAEELHNLENEVRRIVQPSAAMFSAASVQQFDELGLRTAPDETPPELTRAIEVIEVLIFIGRAAQQDREQMGQKSNTSSRTNHQRSGTLGIGWAELRTLDDRIFKLCQECQLRQGLKKMRGAARLSCMWRGWQA